MDEMSGAPSETLARASNRVVENLLVRASRGRDKRSGFAVNGQVPHHAPPPPAAQPTGACGAPAVAGRDAEQEQPELFARGSLELSGSTKVDEEGSDGSDWEDIADGQVITAQRGGSGAPASDGMLTISLSGGEVQRAPRKRTAFTKADRELACLVHRCHLLCLLGRGLLLDEASSHVLLQALVLSLLPLDVVAQLRPESGQQLSSLRMLVEWFKGEFKVSTSNSDGSGTGSGSRGASNEGYGSGRQDEIEGAMWKAKGLQGVLDGLQQVVERRCGCAEELVALFVGALRGHGLVARTVHSLNPTPLKPSDVLRQQELSEHALLVRTISGRPPRYLNPAATADTSAAVAAQPAPAEHGGGGVDGKALGAGADSREKAGRGRGRGGGSRRACRGAARLKEEVAGSRGLQASELAKARERTNQKKRESSEEEDALKNGNAEEDTLAEQQQQSGGKGKGKRRRGTRIQAARTRVMDELGEDPEGQQEVEGPMQGRKARKRKCDEEEEHQLAIAMAATAFEAANAKQQADADGGSRDVKGTSSGSAVMKQGRSKSAAKAASQPAAANGAAYSSHSTGVGNCWAEVFCGPPDTGRWVHVDPLTGWVDRPADVESLAPRGQPLTYVVAFAGGGAKDVIQRYTSSFLAAEKLRDSEWWEDTLRPLRAMEVAGTIAAAAAASKACKSEARKEQAAPSTQQQQQQQQQSAQQQTKKFDSKAGKTAEEVHRLLATREDAELAHRAQQAKRGLPTTIDGFKTHPFYVLERHIGRYQALKPGAKKCGLHRGEGYYLRESLGELHTAERWRREGREVEEAEKPHPAKSVKRRGQKGTGEGGRGKEEAGVDDEDENLLTEVTGFDEAATGEGGLSKLYGYWQTKPWMAPAAAGGKVPRNERGNVEVPPFAVALPTGTVHLRLPYIAPVCRKLQVDYAPALTGFEPRGGRMVPLIDGVVICSEFETLVLSTYLEEERQREEHARRKREAEAEAAWRQLLRAMLTRVRLQQSYGSRGRGGVVSGGGERVLVGGEENIMAEAAADLLRGNQGLRSRNGKPEGLKGAGVPVMRQFAIEADAVDLTQGSADEASCEQQEDQQQRGLVEEDAEGGVVSMRVQQEEWAGEGLEMEEI